MRDDIAIKVDGVSKNYGDLTVLDDLSFEIEAGTTVGVIGRNGAGKTTLLNILAGIIPPSSGKIILNGQVTSILDVGAGFHPDLSGRDNVYMNGQLLGLSKKQVKQLFDEIVEFSEIEEFIDVPVKNYSSGMYLRLAFSVFAHLNSDIILLDEVMGVGDAGFRRKCERKINALANSGATILLVNHDVNSIMNICSRCLYLKNGKLAADGGTDDVVDKYYEKSLVFGSETPQGSLDCTTDPLITNDKEFKIHGVQVSSDAGADRHLFMTDEVRINIQVEKLNGDYTTDMVLRLDSSTGGVVLADSMTFRETPEFKLDSVGKFNVSTVIPKNFLNHGVYYVTLILGKDSHEPEFFERLVKVSIHPSEFESAGSWNFKNTNVRPHLQWKVVPSDQND